MIIFNPGMYKYPIMKITQFWRSACWLIIIFILTFLPGNEVNKVKLFHHADKLIHLLLFVVLSILLLYDLNKFHKVSGMGMNRIFIVIATGMSAGILTEVIQYLYIPGRTGSIIDFISDFTGITTGLILYKLTVR